MVLPSNLSASKRNGQTLWIRDSTPDVYSLTCEKRSTVSGTKDCSQSLGQQVLKAQLCSGLPASYQLAIRRPWLRFWITICSTTCRRTTGSLSPLLFSVYMNDIPFGGTTNLFADDTPSYVIDTSPHTVCHKLQLRTDALCSWFNTWLLSVNSLKSAVMIFRSSKMQPIKADIWIGSAKIPQVRSHRHLGVTFNETFSWSDHVHQIISSASSKTGFLRRLQKKSRPAGIP